VLRAANARAWPRRGKRNTATSPSPTASLTSCSSQGGRMSTSPSQAASAGARTRTVEERRSGAVWTRADQQCSARLYTRYVHPSKDRPAMLLPVAACSLGLYVSAVGVPSQSPPQSRSRRRRAGQCPAQWLAGLTRGCAGWADDVSASPGTGRPGHASRHCPISGLAWAECNRHRVEPHP